MKETDKQAFLAGIEAVTKDSSAKEKWVRLMEICKGGLDGSEVEGLRGVGTLASLIRR